MKRRLWSVLLILAVSVFAFSLTAAADNEDDIEFTIEDDGITITGYTGSEKELVIPEEIGGVSVVRIGNSAFQGNNTLTSITLPETLTSIGNAAFSGSKLKELVIPDSVTFIDSYICSNCSSLKSLTIGSGVTEWAVSWGTNGAFQNCTLLQELTIKEGVTCIPGYAFQGCSLLEELVLPETIEWIGEGAFYGCDLLTSAVVYGEEIGEEAFRSCTSLKSLELNNTVRIKTRAFYDNTALLELNLPETIESIGYAAFCNCTKIRSVEIPDACTYMGAYAFERCTLLSDLVIGSGVTEWDTDWGTGGQFHDCVSLENVTIREGISRIPNSCFKGCTALKTIELPETIEYIDNNAFEKCESMTEITLPEGLLEIGSEAFYELTSLTKADLPASLEKIGPYAFYNTRLREAVIGDNVTSIGHYSFANIPTLKRVYIGESVSEWTTNWGYNCAFEYAERLTDVTIAEGCSLIGSSAFKNCSSLKSIEIPITVTEIGDRAFMDCIALESFTMHRGAIGTAAFYECYSLTDVTLERITTIGEQAFMYCTSLPEIEIPDTVTEIGNQAFESCLSLSEIMIPESVTYLGYNAFAYCSGLVSATVANNVTNYGTSWGDSSTFAECSALRYVVFEDGANILPSNAFRSCYNLEAVVVPDTVKSYNEDMFEYCENVTVYGGSAAEEIAETCNVLYSDEDFEMPELPTYTITLSAGDGGSVSPSGKVERIEGSMLSYYIIPKRGYFVDEVIINGDSIGTWDVREISEDMTIEVTFLKDESYEDPYGMDDEDEEVPGKETEIYDPSWVRFTEEDDEYAMALMYLKGMMSAMNRVKEDDELTYDALLNLLDVVGLGEVQIVDEDLLDTVVTRGELAEILYNYAYTCHIPVGGLSSIIENFDDAWAFQPAVEIEDEDADAEDEEDEDIDVDDEDAEVEDEDEDADVEDEDEDADVEDEDEDADVEDEDEDADVEDEDENADVEDEDEDADVEDEDEDADVEDEGDEVVTDDFDAEYQNYLKALYWALDNGLMYGTETNEIADYDNALCGQAIRLLTSFLADQL